MTLSVGGISNTALEFCMGYLSIHIQDTMNKPIFLKVFSLLGEMVAMLQCDHQSFGITIIPPTLPATSPRFPRGDTMAPSMASNTAAVEKITHHGPVA